MIVLKLASAVAAIVIGIAEAKAASGAMACLHSGTSLLCTQVTAMSAAFPLILSVGPSPDTDAARERERKWIARCRPVLEQDRYGVGRYRYAASGCEFGRDKD